MKRTAHFSKVRANRIKYLKLFPLFIYDIDRVEENDEHWPCYEAKIVDDLVMIPDVEQGDKLFRYGSFGKCEFVRTTTQASPSLLLETIPNSRKRYEKPYRLRTVESTEINETMSDFEKEFLQELNQKMLASSVDQVREENRQACQNILEERRIYSSTFPLEFQSISDNNMEISSAKLVLYERVYLLPEETIFLQHGLGCLSVKDETNQILSPDDLWHRFTLKDHNFPLKYAVYYYFRSSGWIVKCGLKFGCDYMLYKFGPSLNHAVYCVSIENFWQINILLYLVNIYYVSGTRCPSSDRMDGKTVVITGSNTGIGKYAAVELARRGAHVILACRDRKRTEEALRDIRRLSGSEKVEMEMLDLASLQSVRECAKRLRDRLTKLDVLINNAGVMMASGKSVDGYEIHFAVNHLGHFLLTNLLLDLMKKAPSARIINVSSINHAFWGLQINWDDINFTKPYWRMNAYSHSKLANVLFTNELARRLQDTNITANSLHPGVVRTEVTRSILGNYQSILDGIILLITPIWYCLTKTPEQGAQTSIYLATDRQLDHVTGKYFSECKECPSSKTSQDRQSAERLWKLSEEMTNLRDALKEIRNN
ncbi:unnamed protein product [Adineta ricciae]|uniref:tRNA-intron lyase n=1 Tax=Adineta ricciae TaxID=249248 RepID=A0A813WCY3_ADIRI|nr:unnamed protein product [Adineta ricciae]